MRKTKFLAGMFTLCLAATLSLGLAACDDDSDSSSEQSTESISSSWITNDSSLASSASSYIESSVSSSEEISTESSVESSASSSEEISSESSVESSVSSSEEISSESSVESSVSSSEEISSESSVESSASSSEEISTESSVESSVSSSEEISSESSVESSEDYIPETSEDVPPETSEDYIPENSEYVPPETSEEPLPETSEIIPPETSEDIPPETSEDYIPEDSEYVPPETSEEPLPETSEIIPPVESSEYPDSSDEVDPKPFGEAVDEKQWYFALSPEAFENYHMDIVEEVDGDLMFGSLSYTPDAMHMIMNDMEVYCFVEEGQTYAYVDRTGTGSFSKLNLTEMGAGNYEDISFSVYFTVFAPYYDSFVFLDEELAYYAKYIQTEESTYTDIYIMFIDGKLSILSYNEVTVWEDEEVTTSFCSYSFSGYGEVEIILPDFEIMPDEGEFGDGQISQSEWKKALDPSAFDNVRVSTLLNEEGKWILDQEIAWDNGKIALVHGDFEFIDEEGNPFTITSQQYWFADNSAYVHYPFDVDGEHYDYIYVSSGTIGMDLWEYAYNYVYLASMYQDIYSLLTWDGLRGSIVAEDSLVVFVFNEQEQLMAIELSLLDKNGECEPHTIYQYSNYGEIINSFPDGNIYYPVESEN